MPYTLEKLPDAPVILYVQLPGGGVLEDMPELLEKARALLEKQKEPVFVVNDLRKLTISLDEILKSATQTARGENPLLHHPMIRENVYVISDPMILMAIKGLSSATFGRVKLVCFDTVEEAMAYCRDHA